MIRIPWATFSLTALIAIVSIVSIVGIEVSEVYDRFSLIPAEAWRCGGLTLLSSFFLHTSVSHLIWNLYFLLLFGILLEPGLGSKRLLFLVLASAIAGDLLHVLVYPNEYAANAGASGGISGLVAYYALKSPHSRIYILFRDFPYLRWLYVPAWFFFLFCTSLQFWRLYQYAIGASPVLATAHLGGTGAGVFLWMLWKNKNQTNTV
jgi:membrane associated rhomboid family serine protease